MFVSVQLPPTIAIVYGSVLFGRFSYFTTTPRVAMSSLTAWMIASADDSAPPNPGYIPDFASVDLSSAELSAPLYSLAPLKFRNSVCLRGYWLPSMSSQAGDGSGE